LRHDNVSRLGLSAFLAVLLAACGPVSPASPSATRAHPALVLTKSDFDRTVVVRVGQIVEVNLSGWTLFSPSPQVLMRIAAAPPVNGRTTFKAIGSGNQLVTVEEQLPVASCKYECAQLAPRYGHFVVVVVPADQVFDLALSEIDNGRTFLLKPGQRVVAAIPNAALVESDPTVVVVDRVQNDNTLSMLTAQRPGRVQLSGGAFRLTLLVKPATSPYDVVATERDGGTTIPASVGQVIVFRLRNSAGFLPWRGGSGALDSVVDQVAPRDPTATTFTYLVGSVGNVLLRFEDDPTCWDQPTCADIGQILNLSLEVRG
jgi:hypothetical protein